MRTALIFALPEEHETFRNMTGPWRLWRRTPFKSFLHVVGSRELVLVETGMGHRQLLEGLAWLLEQTRPDLITSAGFAGSLCQHLVVGDVCLGEAFVRLEEEHRVRFSLGLGGGCPQDADSTSAKEIAPVDLESGLPMSFDLPADGDAALRLMRVCQDFRLHRSRLVTVNRPYPKALLADRFADRESIMDMESYFAVRFCSNRRIPFLAIRSVSDGLRDEIDFDLTAISDERGRVRVPRVLTSVIQSPGLARSYFRSWKRSRTAALSLGKVLAGLVALPAGRLEALAGSLSYDTT